MTKIYSPSINIKRDELTEYHYYPTANAKMAANQIVNDYKVGLRSFSIIGSYGTGKSAFLLAFEKTTQSIYNFFTISYFKNHNCRYLKLIGAYESLIDRLAIELGLEKNNAQPVPILEKIGEISEKCKQDKSTLFIIIDEFGKFLEFAAKHSPEKEIYFIQQLAELCNNPHNSIVLITTIHQSFESYAFGLLQNQQNEWIKVKGRFREIPFNEPIEELLFLAAKHNAMKIPSQVSEKIIKTSLEIISQTHALNMSEDTLKLVARKLYPLDVLAAYILTLALQRYGQNERSLFSFLESTDHTAIGNFRPNSQPFYSIANVYDFLSYNFFAFLSSKYNPDFASWSSIRSSLEEVERRFEKHNDDLCIVVKVVGMMNTFLPSGSLLSNEFLKDYLTSICGLKDSGDLINLLEQKKIIHFRQHSSRYILFGGTDIDIQASLLNAGNEVSPIISISEKLKEHLKFPFIQAKKYSYITGTPRFFEILISDYPIENAKPEGEIDGFINLIFNADISDRDLLLISKNQSEAIAYCVFKDAVVIKGILFELDKLNRVMHDHYDDKVAVKELESIHEAHTAKLRTIVFDSLFENSESVKWIYNGKVRSLQSKRAFYNLLTEICDHVYCKTPVFRNELVNRHKISPSIHTAKRKYFRALTNEWNSIDLGFSQDSFPPEKTIYLSLLKANGISTTKQVVKMDSANCNFDTLLAESERFIEETKISKKSISSLYDTLSERPFKLKRGLLDFWIPTFIFLRRNDIAIYSNDGFLPEITYEILELMAKRPDDFSIKAFAINGVKFDLFNKYRLMLQQTTEKEIDNRSFISTIKPFLVFYKQLPDYAKTTTRLSEKALNIREVIRVSRDPESTFFNEFPHALGYTIEYLNSHPDDICNFTDDLQSAIKEIRGAYDKLIDRIEDFICKEFIGRSISFLEYKEYFKNRFLGIRRHLLLPHQRTFILRLESALEDKKAWLNSIAQAVIGKTLESFADKDEVLYYESFRKIILELDSLQTLSKIDIDENNEEVLSVKIDRFSESGSPKILRYNKNRSSEIEVLKLNIMKVLSNDSTLNIAALVKILREVMK